MGDGPRPAGSGRQGAAVAYDRWFDGPSGHHALAVESRALVAPAPAVTGARVLDAGCGTGRFTTVLSEAAAFVGGVDPDAAMVALAATRLPGRWGGRRRRAPPVSRRGFDVAVAVTVLEFVVDPAVAMAELAWVTRPGGRILVGALNPHSPWGLAKRRAHRSGGCGVRPGS